MKSMRRIERMGKMIESERVYKNNRFRGLINNHVFQIIKVGIETPCAINVPQSKTVYVTVKDLTAGSILQTNYDAFIRLQLEECEYLNTVEQ